MNKYLKVQKGKSFYRGNEINIGLIEILHDSKTFEVKYLRNKDCFLVIFYAPSWDYMYLLDRLDVVSYLHNDRVPRIVKDIMKFLTDYVKYSDNGNLCNEFVQTVKHPNSELQFGNSSTVGMLAAFMKESYATLSVQDKAALCDVIMGQLLK